MVPTAATLTCTRLRESTSQIPSTGRIGHLGRIDLRYALPISQLCIRTPQSGCRRRRSLGALTCNGSSRRRHDTAVHQCISASLHALHQKRMATYLASPVSTSRVSSECSSDAGNAGVPNTCLAVGVGWIRQTPRPISSSSCPLVHFTKPARSRACPSLSRIIATWLFNFNCLAVCPGVMSFNDFNSYR